MGAFVLRTAPWLSPACRSLSHLHPASGLLSFSNAVQRKLKRQTSFTKHSFCRRNNFQKAFLSPLKKKKKKRKQLSVVAAFGISLYLTRLLLWKKSNHHSRLALLCDMPRDLEELVLKTGFHNSAPRPQQAWGLVFPLILPHPLAP